MVAELLALIFSGVSAIQRNRCGKGVTIMGILLAGSGEADRNTVKKVQGSADWQGDILLTGFEGTSAELLVKKAVYKSLILPNDKVLDAQILFAEIGRRSYRYVFSFGQKPVIRDKVYLETVARNGDGMIRTDFACGKLQDALKAEDLEVRISDNAGTSFCNALYWNALACIRDQGMETKMIFVHIPFCKNMPEMDSFFDKVLKAVENFCRVAVSEAAQ